MFALLYPTPPGPTATSGNAWFALAVTGAILFALALSAWAVVRRWRREEMKEGPVRPTAEVPRAA